MATLCSYALVIARACECCYILFTADVHRQLELWSHSWCIYSCIGALTTLTQGFIQRGGGPWNFPPPSHNFPPPPEILKLSMVIIVAGEEPGYQAIHQT